MLNSLDLEGRREGRTSRTDGNGDYAIPHVPFGHCAIAAEARRLAEGMAGIPGLSVTPPQTNIVFAQVAEGRGAELTLERGSESARVTVRSFKGTITISTGAPKRSRRPPTATEQRPNQPQPSRSPASHRWERTMGQR